MRRHPLYFGGGPSFSGGMSAGERQDLLKFEDSLAKDRDKAARQFQEESEARRVAQEREQRKALTLTEQQRIDELESMERDAMEAAQGSTDVTQADKDSKVTNMWSNLMGGAGSEATPTIGPGNTESTSSQRPE